MFFFVFSLSLSLLFVSLAATSKEKEVRWLADRKRQKLFLRSVPPPMTLTSLLIKQTLQPFSHYDYYYYYYLLLMLLLLFSRRSWRDSSARQQLVQSPRDCCRMASPIHQCSGRNAQRFLIQMRYFDRLLNRIHDKLLSLWRIRKKNFVEEMARFVLPFSFVTLRYLIKLIYYI